MSSTTTTVDIPSQYGAFDILARDVTEEGDAKMPKTVGHGLLLLTQTGESAAADMLRLCMDRYLALLAAGPSGSLIVNVGQACLCWDCGFIGLPGNSDELEATAEAEGQVRSRMPEAGPHAQCRHCSRADRTNYIIGRQADGPLPFLEASTPVGQP